MGGFLFCVGCGWGWVGLFGWVCVWVGLFLLFGGCVLWCFFCLFWWVGDFWLLGCLLVVCFFLFEGGVWFGRGVWGGGGYFLGRFFFGLVGDINIIFKGCWCLLF